MKLLTTVSSWLVQAWEWLVAALAYLNKPPLPLPDPNVAPAATAYAIIMSESISIPPMPVTGGVIHPVLSDDATYLATQIVANNKTTNRICLKLAWIKNESRFDHLAFNPNNQLNTPGETTDQKLQHADIGLAQFDMATLKSDYAGQFAGMTDEEIEAQAFDLEWAYHSFEAYTNALLDWAQSFPPTSVTIGTTVYPLQTLCALEAYNKGRGGVTALVVTITGATTTALESDFKYAIGILSDATTYSKSFAS
jgi:hypothetical protein